MCEVPKRTVFSSYSGLESCPSGSSFLKKTLGSEVMTWKCLATGRKFSITSTARLCIHQATLPADVDEGRRRRDWRSIRLIRYEKRLPARLADEAVDTVREQPAAVVDGTREGDHPDAAEDQVRLPVRVVAVALLGRRVAEEPARLGDEPAREQDQDADEDRGLEEVAHEPVRPAEQVGREREGIEACR